MSDYAAEGTAFFVTERQASHRLRCRVDVGLIDKGPDSLLRGRHRRSVE